MRILSVNVGMPREIEYKGKKVQSGIVKEPTDEALEVLVDNIRGDGQADLKVHGGLEKAVYAYGREHYPHWQKELNRSSLPWGAFGENLTTEGLLESDVLIGDLFRCGDAELRVTQPRLPCFKLNMHFRRDDMVRLFQDSGRCGIYFAVARPGRLRAGDQIERIERIADNPSLLEILDVLGPAGRSGSRTIEALERGTLPPLLAEKIRKKLEK